MRPICQDAQLTPSTVRYRRAEWVITLNTCIWHISVAPLYITGVKRWVQVCTCTDLSVQIHSKKATAVSGFYIRTLKILLC